MNREVWSVPGEPRPKRPHRRRWFSVGLLAAFILTGGLIGTVYSWAMHEVAQENYLQSHNTSVDIEEEFPNPVITPNQPKVKKVSFTNTGSSAVFLRVAYGETWNSYINGEWHWLADDGTHSAKNWTSVWTDDFVYIDGWYYYKKVLPSGGNTGDVINSVTFPSNLPAEYRNAFYSLDFIAEVVQLSDEALVNSQAVLTVWGRSATVTVGSVSNGTVTSGTVSWS